MSDAPDAELLEQFARNHSEAAFAKLVERYIGLVYSTAFRKTSNPQQAEDITQAVFIILARKAGSLGPKTVLPAWLHHTARLTAANLQRAELRRIRREQEVYMQSTLSESAPDALWHKLSPLLDDAVDSLGKADRDAIVLRFFENKNFTEVGGTIGTTEQAARMRLNRALGKLCKYFSRRGVNSTTAVIAGAISANSVQAAPPALVKSVTAIALAKGAGASAATLALAKGTLSFVSWAKATLLVGTVAVVTVGSITFMSSWFHSNSGTIDDRIAQVTLPGTTLEDVIRVMGEPNRYWTVNGTLDKEHLPNGYHVSYPNGIQMLIWKGKVVEVECIPPGPGFSYEGVLRIGSSLDDVLSVLGPPTETISRHPEKGFMPHRLSGLGGVLYTEIGGQMGKSYYWRPDQEIRFTFEHDVVSAIFVDVPNYWPSTK
ncbi:MAG TPA: sigma-70 family RNA polymerase sigma factor [Candidatus Sulfotelmatobacter sp.]|nr:sigma-70 family RNA polymerase sigma factor [Candidatus Sulfotelmatobacter sp.]